MKKNFIYRITPLIVLAIFIFASCTKESSDVRLDPKLSTSQTLNVTSDSATVVGFVIAQGDGFTEKGICYDVEANPTTGKKKVALDKEVTTATYTIRIGGLTYATKYYARAYAIGPNGTVYGDEITFTTLPVIPIVTTKAITSITGNSASGGGEVTATGGADVISRGVCIATTHDPIILFDGTTIDGNGAGSFTSILTGLKGNTVYYVRAYAINSVGIAYGQEVSFTTLVDLPAVSTIAVTEVTKTSAKSGGEVTYDGGGTVTARGLAWSLNTNPTISDNIITGGSGVGLFTSNLSGLDMNTTYHVRAFATNSAGTSYGNDLSFTTMADITKFWVVGTYNSWSNSDAAKYIISTATNTTAEGYVYFPASGEFKLTTDHSWDDAHTFGDDGAGKLTNPGNNITIGSEGYYLIKASLVDMTYSRVKTIWGVIGDATPGGWDNETALSYNSTTETWTGIVHLTAASFKFRANSSWDYNYGSTSGDEKLDAGGSNINITTESDYQFSLNLSVPHEYTYTAYRWGVIGDATAGGWSTDTNMSWDATNKVFTVTLDMTAGSFKFRANDDWGVNYGGDLNALSAGGANINISAAGNYTITFDPYALKGTVTKN